MINKVASLRPQTLDARDWTYKTSVIIVFKIQIWLGFDNDILNLSI